MIPNAVVLKSVFLYPAPLAGNLELGVTPAYAGGFQSIITGANIGGSSVVFSQLYGLAGYTARGGGWMELGQPRGDVSRQIKGLEDSKELKG